MRHGARHRTTRKRRLNMTSRSTQIRDARRKTDGCIAWGDAFPPPCDCGCGEPKVFGALGRPVYANGVHQMAKRWRANTTPRPQTRPDVKRYPLSNLAAMQHMEVGVWVGDYNVHRRLIDIGVGIDQADRLAVACGHHPFEVWPEMVDDILEDMEEVA